MNANLIKLVSRLDKVRQSGGGFQAVCPAHDDRIPSLSVKAGSNGTVLVHCFAGCNTGDVVSAVGLKFSDLFAS